jgi:hypothetical protein
MTTIEVGMRVYVKDCEVCPGWGRVTDYDPESGYFRVNMEDGQDAPKWQVVYPEEIGVRGWPDEYDELDRLDELTDRLSELLREPVFYSEQEAQMEQLVAEREAILRAYA